MQVDRLVDLQRLRIRPCAMDVDFHRIVDADLDGIADEFLEAGELGLHHVGARDQVGQSVVAGLVGFSGGGDAGSGVGGADVGVGDDGAGGVGDATEDGAPRLLGGESH